MTSPSSVSIPRFREDEIYFIPLGGSEEFGMNFNLYGMKGKWLAVDCGIAFADERHPGIDVLLPDPTFIEDRRKDLVGLIVTHAHEDHIGAVCHLWQSLKCPIYCTRFTAAVLREKMKDDPHAVRGMIIHEIGPDQKITLNPFVLQFIPVSHSIPDSVSFTIETPHGLVVHSGDWNADPTPVLGTRTNDTLFKAAGREGVLAYIGDSTNAPVPGRGKSERDVEAGLESVFGECTGRIVVTLFASNIARIQSIARATARSKRRLAVVGRSLHRMIGCARQCGYLRDIQEIIAEEEIDRMPADRLVILATGSQGEGRAALARMAAGTHPFVSCGAGDTVIFSARAIPGNEKEINAVKNNLIRGRARVVGPDDTAHPIHVSGHPCRDEILDMFAWVRPQIVVPVHGERIQLEAHAALARGAQIPHALVPTNGSVIRLAPGVPSIIGQVETGMLALEPSRIIPVEHAAIAARRNLQFSGVVHATVLMGRDHKPVQIEVTEIGLFDDSHDEDAELSKAMAQQVRAALSDADPGKADTELREIVRVALRRYIRDILQIKTKVTVHLVRLNSGKE